MQVVKDRVMLKKIEQPKTNASGFYLPTAEDSEKATVIKVGDGRVTEDGTRIPVAVAVNDTVLYNPATAISVTINREVFLIIKEEDIYAIIDSN